MDFKTLNDLRNGAAFAKLVGRQLEQMQKARVKVKRERPITDEVVLEVKPRSEFPSRQTYRAHVRAWAKQRIRFAKAYARGDLAPHLIPVVESGS